MNPILWCSLFTHGERHRSPLFDRSSLLPGHRIDGPAIIVESTGTVVIEPGWQAQVRPGGNLVLECVEPQARKRKIGTDADPIMLEVFNNLFMSIAEQMGAALQNTAHSVNIKERLDFSGAVFDAEGLLIAKAPHMPVHLGSMGESVRHIIADEGVLIDDFLLVEAGCFREAALRELLASGAYPARNPDQNIADLQAQVAANEKGVQGLGKMVRHFGLGAVHTYMGHVQDNAEESVRPVLEKLSTGEFRYQMDGGCSIAVRIEVDNARRSARIDFAATSAQQPSNFNAPAAVVAGDVETSQYITDTLYGALGVLAASHGTMNNLTFGNQTHQYYETICGGSGAGPGFDGADAVHTHMTNSRLTDPEILQWRFPVRLERFEVRRDSGGDGRYRGGDGVRCAIRFLEPMTVAILSGHRRIAPYGAAGGEPGALGRNWVERADGSIHALAGADKCTVDAGNVVVIETPGGGGYGRVSWRLMALSASYSSLRRYASSSG